MSNTLWVVVTVPQKEYEVIIRDKEDLCRSLKKLKTNINGIKKHGKRMLCSMLTILSLG